MKTLKSGMVWQETSGTDMLQIILWIYLPIVAILGICASPMLDTHSFGEYVSFVVFWPIWLVKVTIKGFMSMWKNIMPSVTLSCQHCNYSARRALLNATACRGVHNTPSEPAYCPKGHGMMIRKDGFVWDGSSNPVPDKQHNWRRQIIHREKAGWCDDITSFEKCTKCGQTRSTKEEKVETECPGTIH
jgi:hypothetical protein